jgi:hypothetical protein
MNKYYVSFSGGVWVESETPEQASDKFNSEFDGDDISDSIDHQWVEDENGNRLKIDIFAAR